MSDEPITRKAMRAAERGTPADTSRLIAAVPALMREARRRSESERPSPTLAQLAVWALPRLAAATAVAVIAATWIVSRERGDASTASTPATSTTLESVILGGSGNGTGDVVFDALLDVRRSDG
jgi:hypothetical protein